MTAAPDPRAMAARDYTKRGYTVVMLRGKAPVRDAWPDHPLTLEEIDAEGTGWRWNIGCLLVNEHRRVLIDVDVKDGAPGMTTLEEWSKDCPDFALGEHQITPSGGRHYLFRVPDGVDMNTLPNGAIPGTGIDVLRHRRQFVLAPSFTDQGEYRGALPHTPADAPVMSPQLLAILQRVGRITSSASQNSGPDRAPSLDLVREAVRRMPNSEDTSRDEWVRMALLIRGAVGPKHEAEGLELFQEWAAGWPGNNPEENARVYETAKPKGGWHALCTWAGMEAEEARAVFAAADSEPNPPPVTYTRRRARDLYALPRPEWLVEDLLLEHSQAMLFGQSGAGKSFCNLHLACCIAGGKPFHGRKVKQGPAVIILLEGYEDYRRRLPAQLRELGLPDDTPVELIDGNEPRKPRFKLSDPKARAAMIETLKQSGPVYVSIDTAARATAGLDENSNSHEAIVLECLDRIQQDVGAAVNLVHHAGWANEHARGASARRAGMDLELHLTRSGETTLELKVTKARSARDGYAFGATLAPVTVTLPDGTMERTLVYRPVTTAQAAFGLGVNDRNYAMLECLRNSEPDGLTATQWGELAGGWKKTHLELRRALLDAGLVNFEKHGRSRRYHITPAGETALAEHARKSLEMVA